MNVKIKLCGIRRREDAEYMNEFLPDYCGFIFAPTRREVTPAQAEMLCGILSPRIKRVGVFVNKPLGDMHIYNDILDVYQLHGDEDEDYITELRSIIPAEAEIWKAARVRTAEDITKAESLPCDKLLLDAFSKEAYGGTGRVADWDIISSARPEKPFFAAGGINSANITEAIKKLSPYGVDLSSGIETDGVKDRSKIAEIMKILRRSSEVL